MARDPKYDCLFEPIRIGPKTMRNRFYQVPHCNGAGVDFMGANAAFRGVKAEGGWGGVCTEAITIDPETDTQPMKLCNIWDDGDVQNLRHLTDAIHAWDSLAGAELAHGGVPSLNLNSRGVARTATEAGSAWTLATYTHEADLDDIREVQELFVDAAKRAIQAGFDIVYIYGSHSVLPMQFLSPQYNKRQTELKADSVVLVTGRTANSGLYKDLLAAQGRMGEERRPGGLPGRRLLRAPLHQRGGVRRPPDRPRVREREPAAPAALHPRARALERGHQGRTDQGGAP